MAKLIFDQLKETIFRDDILNKRRRPDGTKIFRDSTDHVGSRLVTARSRFGAIHSR